NNNQDMLTKLTDSLLFIIISLLSFKEAARTSILSKRWHHIWHATKNIEFNESFFVNHGESDRNKRIQRKVFIDFALQWIRNYGEPVIDKFTLAFSRPKDFLDEVQHFVTFSTAHSVKVLVLDFSDPTWNEYDLENHEASYDLPSNVYGNKTLESLKLFTCNFIMSRFKNFSVLKELSLGWIDLKHYSIRDLLLDCPLLESLTLKRCYNIGYLEISVPSSRLKTLVVDKCDFGCPWFYVEGPKLRLFKYCGTVCEFQLENQRCMEEADLDFGLEFSFEEVGHLLYNLLQDLFAVKTLTVCSYMLQVLPNGEEPLSMQSPLDVRHLILRTALHSNEFCGIKFLLKSCPLLETLTIDISPARIFPDYTPPYEFDPREAWTKKLIVYKCLLRSLKVVEVKGFKGTMSELHVLQYLSVSGRAMKQLNLFISREMEGDGENMTRLYMQRAQIVQQFKKASCQLIVSI
ncbi:FBD domain-containing protein, partial [Cephalotus follicularis]